MVGQILGYSGSSEQTNNTNVTSEDILLFHMTNVLCIGKRNTVLENFKWCPTAETVSHMPSTGNPTKYNTMRAAWQEFIYYSPRHKQHGPNKRSHEKSAYEPSGPLRRSLSRYL